MKAMVSNASAPSTPPIIGPTGGIDVEGSGEVVEEGSGEVVEEGSGEVVEEGSGNAVAIGSGVTAKKSRKKVAKNAAWVVITNVWLSVVNSDDWKNRS